MEDSSPPWQHLGNLSPAVAQHFMGLADYAIFLLCPAGFFHLGVEVIMPALAALLPQPALQVLGNQRPLFCAILLDQLNDLGENISERPAPQSPPLKHRQIWVGLTSRGFRELQA